LGSNGVCPVSIGFLEAEIIPKKPFRLAKVLGTGLVLVKVLGTYWYRVRRVGKLATLLPPPVPSSPPEFGIDRCWSGVNRS